MSSQAGERSGGSCGDLPLSSLGDSSSLRRHLPPWEWLDGIETTTSPTKRIAKDRKIRRELSRDADFWFLSPFDMSMRTIIEDQQPETTSGSVTNEKALDQMIEGWVNGCGIESTIS